ncbi:hypothetical protein [Vibrio palustris]|uniref:hypothetical protein n=1 Tax=Vibrio palustris TaxID=1918946 RepID=UPI0013966C20|nr:hypothetical protein [Vibrio palustris]
MANPPDTVQNTYSDACKFGLIDDNKVFSSVARDMGSLLGVIYLSIMGVKHTARRHAFVHHMSDEVIG